ncbi:MAG: helix-turn-helix transcriptional regulator [Lachnospiraceae bacterium]|nr:helix-turn-helix transcriptional regulator [Lachnospiraceae bacterium]
MAYPNLAAEMARNGLTEKDLAQEIGRSADTIRNWMHGKGDFPIGKALIIRKKFFPQTQIEYLYSSTPTAPPAGMGREVV